MPIYKNNKVNTPIAHKIYKRGICLPSYFALENSDIDYICDVLRTYIISNPIV